MEAPLTETVEKNGSQPEKVTFVRPLIFLLVIAGVLILARAFNLNEYFQEARLRQFIDSYGMWGPLIYLLIWTIAPSLLLPGAPIMIAGGLLFGPFWGVVYAALGSSAGSSLAFLVARYLARDWVAVKISRSRLAHLDEKVAQHGWKIVAFTRVIGMPFFLVNYAFGLTRIQFLPYALASFFGMLPWTIALVLVSSNLLALLRGQVSVWMIIGFILLAVVGLVAVIYKRLKTPPGEAVEI
jgi:uncharacterized membrane protein YdjX (TVP38/TMEM64 family)